jgi:hypothetical protein
VRVSSILPAHPVIVFRLENKINFTKAGLVEEFLHYLDQYGFLPDAPMVKSALDGIKIYSFP